MNDKININFEDFKQITNYTKFDNKPQENQNLINVNELDKENKEFYNAVDLIKHTNHNLFITGNAGTGKTTFLKYIIQTSNKEKVVIAPTGIAAINAGGQTIHSLFVLKPNDIFTNPLQSLKDYLNAGHYAKAKIDIFQKMELLLIDEVSMVRYDILDMINQILTYFRKNKYSNYPFGKVQVVLLGDVMQLPPINFFKTAEVNFSFPNPFFFNSESYKNGNFTHIELQKVYRQKDQSFIDILNRIRASKQDYNDLNKLNQKYDPNFEPNNEDNYITLCNTNDKANIINKKKLNEIDAELYKIAGKTEGQFNLAKPTNDILEIKIGAQVMILINDKGEYKKYYNGSIGKITSIPKEDEDIKYIKIKLDNVNDNSDILISKHTWENVEYKLEKDNDGKDKLTPKVIGKFTQYPIKLAWAITVHKSQGLTFDKVIADLAGAFAEGQVYVALSRCTSLDGLVLKTCINDYDIKVNKIASEFCKNITEQQIIEERIKSGKVDKFYKETQEYLEKAFDSLCKAIKYKDNINQEILQNILIKTKEIENKIATANQKVLEKAITSKKDINYKLKKNQSKAYNKTKPDYKKNQRGKIVKILHDNEKGKNGFIKTANGSFYFVISSQSPLNSKLILGCEVLFTTLKHTKGTKAKIINVINGNPKRDKDII